MRPEFWAVVEGFGPLHHAWSNNAPWCQPDYDGISPFNGSVLLREKPDASVCCTKCAPRGQ